MDTQIESKGGSNPTEKVADSTSKILRELSVPGRLSICHSLDKFHFYIPVISHIFLNV